MRTVKELPPDVIERWLKDEDCEVRLVAAGACDGRKDIPFDVIRCGLKDEDSRVRAAVIKACRYRKEIPLDIIDVGLHDEDCNVAHVAAEVSLVLDDVPLDVIERWLKEENWYTRRAAIRACRRDEDLPLIRTFEPPERVYKKCLGGVIVVANIPKDAQVRGGVGKKCRANKAIITDIIGEIQGEKIGVSRHDGATMYKIGDVVEIGNFDYLFYECAPGFHFFCTEEEARRHNE